MSLVDGSNGNMVMPVAPAGGYGGYGTGFGGDGWWLILLILFAFGGFGGYGMGGGAYGPGMLGAMGGAMYPWLNQSDQISSGFYNQALNGTVNGIQGAVNNGFSDVQLGIAGVNQNICQTGGQIVNGMNQGFAGVNAAIANTAAQAEIANAGRYNTLTQQLYGNEIANLNRSFAEQTANTQGFTNMQSQLAQCCCDNRLAAANLQSVVQSENCADRAALSDGIRDVIANNTANTTAMLNTINGGIQSVKDQLCQLELSRAQDKIDAKNETIQNLRDQLNMANLAASQTAQTSRLLADNAAQTQAVENYIRPQVNPCYIVPNPNGCNCNYGCGYNSAA